MKGRLSSTHSAWHKKRHHTGGKQQPKSQSSHAIHCAHHFNKALENKRRKLARHLRHHPNDLQAAAAVK